MGMSDERLAEWDSEAERDADGTRASSGYYPSARIHMLIAEVSTLRAKVEAAEANRDVAHEYADQLEAECRRWKRKARKKDRDRKAAQAEVQRLRDGIEGFLARTGHWSPGCDDLRTLLAPQVQDKPEAGEG
jgi:chromosome segregation ATPase